MSSLRRDRPQTCVSLRIAADKLGRDAALHAALQRAEQLPSSTAAALASVQVQGLAVSVCVGWS